MTTASDKLGLIDKIGSELQSRYTFDQLEEFLAASGIKPPSRDALPYNSKWRYTRMALQGADTETIPDLADKLHVAFYPDVPSITRLRDELFEAAPVEDEHVCPCRQRINVGYLRSTRLDPNGP